MLVTYKGHTVHLRIYALSCIEKPAKRVDNWLLGVNPFLNNIILSFL